MKKSSAILLSILFSFFAYSQTSLDYHYLLTRSESGDTKSTIELAKMLWKGEYVKRNTKKAEQLLNKCIDDGSKDALVTLVLLLDEDGDRLKSQSVVEQRLSAFSGDEHSVIDALLSSLMKKQAPPEQIMEWVDFFMHKGIHDYSLYYYKGNIYRQQGMNDKALEAYDQCLEMNASYANGYLGKASIYYKMAEAYAREGQDNIDDSKQRSLLENFQNSLQLGVEADEKALTIVKSEITKASIERRLAKNRQLIHDVTYKIQSITGPSEPQATAQQQETNIAKEATVDDAVPNESSAKEVTVDESPKKEDAIAAEASEPSQEIQNVESNAEVNKSETAVISSNVSTEKPNNVEQMIVEKPQPETIEPSISKSGKKARIEQSIGVSTAQLWETYEAIEYDSKGEPSSFTGITDDRILFLPGYSIGCRLPIGLYFGALLEGTYIKPFEYNGPGYLQAYEYIERGEFQLIFCLEANYMLTELKSVHPFVTAGIGLNVVGAKGINPTYLKAGVRVPLGLKNGIDIGVGFLDMFDKSLTFSVAYSF